MAKRNVRENRKPLVILMGSGVHKEILGKGCECSPLASWSALLQATAARAGLRGEIVSGDSLTAAWEAIVLTSVRTGFKNARGDRVRACSRGPAAVDRCLRTVCAAVLREEARRQAGKYSSHAWPGKLKCLMDRREVHVIDFNFDMLIANACGVKGKLTTSVPKLSKKLSVARTALEPLFRSWSVPGANGSQWWKPHGWVDNSTSLHLGVREFGLQGAAYSWAFGAHKADQKQAAGNRSGQAAHWVAEVMRNECCLIGLGLGPDEWDLRWLFNQRARDQVRKNPKCPARWLHARPEMPVLGMEVCPHSSWSEALAAAVEG